MNTRQLQLATLEAIESDVKDLILNHTTNRGSLEDLWMPSDFAHKFRKDTLIPEDALVALVYNALTEDGLPSFHRLIASHLGEDSVWGTWNGIWTAEESRHGRALEVFLAESQQVHMRVYDEMLFTYHLYGFNPTWEQNPYRLLAYTVLQERATQISHTNVANKVRMFEPTLATLLVKIAREEARHCRFYSETFRLVLALDAPNALVALANEIRSFAMPGATIPHFSSYQYLAECKRVFTTHHFKEIVEGVIKLFRLDQLRFRDEMGEIARQDILRLAKLLARRTARLAPLEPKNLEFSFLVSGSVVV